MKNQDIQNQVWGFYSQIRGHIDYYGSAKKIIQLLFLRSILDDATDYNLSSIDDMKVLFKYQNEITGMFLTEATIRDTFTVIDRAFFETGLGLGKAAPLYQFLFEAHVEDQKAIIGALHQFDLPKDPAGRWEIVKAIYQLSSRDISKFEESNSPESIIKLGNMLLGPKPTDHYLDAFSGLSTAFLSLPENGYGVYEGFEKNPDTFATSLMLIIMLKRQRAFVYNADFFNVPEESIYDAIFCDGPLTGRLDDRDQLDAVEKYGFRESDVLSCYRIMHMLSDKGRAVVTVAGRFLFSNAKPYEQARQMLTEEGLKAIIYLPGGILSVSSVPINLLYIERGYTGPIALVDAREIAYAQNKLSKTLSDEIIREIGTWIERMQGGSEYLRIMDRRVLLVEEGANWNPGKLFAKKLEQKHRGIDEIDADIEDTLRKLSEIMK